LREKQVNVLYPLDLSDDQLYVCQEPFRVVIMQDIHIHSLIATGEESFAILFGFDASANRGNDQSSWIDGLQITSRHLQDYRVCRWHHCNDSGTSLDASASLILLWLVEGDFQLWQTLACNHAPVLHGVHTVDADQVGKFEQMLRGRENQMSWGKCKRRTIADKYPLICKEHAALC
jgi:hypothetical protein